MVIISSNNTTITYLDCWNFESQDEIRSLETDIRFMLEGVLLPIIGMLGIVGNSLSLHVLLCFNLELKPVYQQLLSSLVVWDLIFIALSIPLFSLVHIFPRSYALNIFPWVVPYLYPLTQIAQQGSVYSTLAVALERYLAVCRPSSYIPAEAGYILMILIIFFTFLFNLPRFFELKTLSLPHCKYVTVEPTVLRLSPAYSTITMVSSVVFLNIIPFICLIFINKQIYSVIQQKIKILETLNKRKRRDITVSLVLVFIVVIFLICNSLKTCLNLYELSITMKGKELKDELDKDKIFRALSILSNVLIVFNSSINFLIYLFKDPKFQKALISHLSHLNPLRVWKGEPGAGEVAEDEQTQVAGQQEYAL